MRNRRFLIGATMTLAVLLTVPTGLAQCSGPCVGDLDGDCDVDLSDLALLLANYGKVCGRVAHWCFDEASGNLVVDSIRGHDGTATEDVVPSEDVPTCVPGNLFSRCFPGDYNGGHIEVPDHYDLDLTDDFTLEAWIKATLTPGEGRQVLAKHQHGTNHDGSWALELTGSGLVRFAAFPYAGSSIVFDSDPDHPVSDGEWTHIAFAYDEAQDHYDFYIGGVPAGSGTAGIGEVIGNTSRPLWIGGLEGDPDQRSFNGCIDEVQMWNECRSPAQVQEDMCSR